MRQVVLEKPRQIRLREVPVPVPNKGEVLVRVRACGICGSDILSFEGAHPFVNYPIVQGHEFSGEVAEVGEEVEVLKKGDRVVVQPSVYCGKCNQCLRGRYNICDELKVLGRREDGAFAEYVCANAIMAYKMPSRMSYEDGALVEPAAVAVHAIRRSNLKLGDSVVILGAGPIGLMLLQCCKAAGARSVAITDMAKSRLQIAGRLGADITIDIAAKDPVSIIESQYGKDGVDLVFEAVGAKVTIDNAIRIARKGAEIVIVGQAGEIPVNAGLILRNELLVSGTLMYGHQDFPRAITLISQGRVKTSDLITHRFSLEQVMEAYQLIEKRKENVVKVLIIP